MKNINDDVLILQDVHTFIQIKSDALKRFYNNFVISSIQNGDIYITKHSLEEAHSIFDW